MNALDVSMRVMHILGATMLVGGIIFQRAAVTPALLKLDGSDSALAVRETMRRRGAVITMLSAFLLLASGLVNIGRIEMNYQMSGAYHMLFGIKLLLAFVIFALASILTGRTATAQKLRQRAEMWLNVTIVVSLVVLSLGAVLKMSDHEPKVKQTASPATRDIEGN